MMNFAYIVYIIYYCIILNAHCYDVNISQFEDDIDDITSPVELDVSQYTLYFKSYHSVWNNHDEWSWISSHNVNTSINETVACSKQNPSLCINTTFITNRNKEIESLKSIKLQYIDDELEQNNVELDFWNDLDWSQINILHHNDVDENIDRRQLLRGALSSKYGEEYYDYDDYDDDDFYDDIDDNDEYDGFAAKKIDTMEEMNDFIFNQDDDIEDIYNIDDYYKFSDRMSAEQWGVFKKIWKGIKKGAGRLARGIGNKIGIYARPPCSGSSRCRVHLYNKRSFRKRANKKGHFCEGRWDRWRLHKYRVRRRRISSMMVQGSPCCVVIAYNGNKFDGDLQAMFPRGRYRSMRMGLSTSMGAGNGMNGMGGGGMMGAMGGGMGMMGAHMEGFRDKALASMKIVHDCKLRQRLMKRGMGRMGAWNGMHGGMGGMGQMMQMMMMMKMMFPHHHKKKHSMCRYYSCIVKTQQSQLQQLMQMMMMSAMTNQAPITISDNTKKKRRRMTVMRKNNNMHVIGVKKCKILYYKEICLTFDAVNNVIMMDYSIKNKKDIKEKEKEKESSSAFNRIKSLVSLFDNVNDPNNIDFDDGDDDDDDDDIHFDDVFEKEEEEEIFDDIDNWIDPDPFDLFIDYLDIGPEASEFSNRYYDEVVLESFDNKNKDKKVSLPIPPTINDKNDEEAAHRLRLFLGPLTYGMLKNELIFPDDFGYDMEYSYLNIPTDNDIIDYFDTFILEWNNKNDWNIITNTTHSHCNDIILSYISYSICINNDGLIYFNKNDNDNNYIKDEGLEIFYQKTNFMIGKELDNTKLNILNEKDWTEIYQIYDNNIQKRKLCNYISMIKLCVEGEMQSILKDFKVSIEYLSDEESKGVIRESNRIFNEWLLWSDFS